jgi:hypothetical protein
MYGGATTRMAWRTLTKPFGILTSTRSWSIVSDTPKRFEDWEEVDCNECSHYWDSSCDGASKGSKVACNSYSATRSVVIPAKVNALEKRVKLLTTLVGCLIAYAIGQWIGVLLFG